MFSRLSNFANNLMGKVIRDIDTTNDKLAYHLYKGNFETEKDRIETENLIRAITGEITITDWLKTKGLLGEQ